KGARPLDGPRRRGVARRRRHHRASAAALDAALHPPLQPGRIAGARGPRGRRSARHAGWAGSPPPDPLPRSARPGGAGAPPARRRLRPAVSIVRWPMAITLSQDYRPGMVDLKAGRLSREIFVSDAIYHAELERLFARAWLFVGHESQIPNPGDFAVSGMGEVL